MMTVEKLIQLLNNLDPHTLVFTAEKDGVFPLELGNQCPFKVGKKKDFLFIDDGLGFHGDISETWVPLDECQNQAT